MATISKNKTPKYTRLYICDRLIIADIIIAEVYKKKFSFNNPLNVNEAKYKGFVKEKTGYSMAFTGNIYKKD
jgi:hypothetical protein